MKATKTPRVSGHWLRVNRWCGRTAYLKEVLKKLGIPEVKLDEESYLIDLEEELFNGHVRVIVKDRDVMLAIPPPQRFICHDAIVTATAGQLMGPDFITPTTKAGRTTFRTR